MSRLGLKWVVASLDSVVNTGSKIGLLPGVSSVMGFGNLNVGQVLPLQKTLKKAVATAAIAGTLGLGLFMSSVGTAVSGGETRTISLVHQHTKEKLTVTYMKNGRYVPSGMKQLNRFFRDWRRNEVTTIDPKTIDLVWELHADLGSKRPIHIVSGYRSPKTNAFLKRIGRNVAKKSQHMKGKAIDFFFPDVSTQKIRNSALARRVGGVGYYRSSGGPTGFLHADSGNVRHWGPKIGRSQLASIIKEGRKTIGRRGGKRGVFDGVAETSVAGNDATSTKKSKGLLGWFRGDSEDNAPEVATPEVAKAPEPALESIYDAEDDELADLSADAAAASAAEDKAKALLKKKPVSPVVEDQPAFVEAAPEVVEPFVAKKDRGALAALAGTAVTEEQAEKRPTLAAASLFGNVPKPRLKPRTVLALAEAKANQDVVIQPVSAVPEQTWSKKSNKPSPVEDAIGTVEGASSIADIEDSVSTAADGKSNLITDLRDQNADDLVVIKPVLATSTEPSWLSSIYATAEASLRRDGVKPAPAAIASMPVAAILGPDGSGEIEIAAPIAAEGKGDLLTVNREGKTGLPPMKLRLSSK
jgi:uncharacterized protein YcbK (DUF882 family)